MTYMYTYDEKCLKMDTDVTCLDGPKSKYSEFMGSKLT